MEILQKSLLRKNLKNSDTTQNYLSIAVQKVATLYSFIHRLGKLVVKGLTVFPVDGSCSVTRFCVAYTKHVATK